jgi:hypothetical protein
MFTISRPENYSDTIWHFEMLLVLEYDLFCAFYHAFSCCPFRVALSGCMNGTLWDPCNDASISILSCHKQHVQNLDPDRCSSREHVQEHIQDG